MKKILIPLLMVVFVLGALNFLPAEPISFNLPLTGGTLTGGLTISAGAFIPSQETVTCVSDACAETAGITTYFIVSDGGADANADALTLGDGSAAGQIAHFVFKTETDAGDSVVVDTAKQVQWTACTFAEVGDSCTLIWDGTNWHMLASYGL